MPLAALILLNLPVFLFLAWLMFDDKSLVDDTVGEATVAILKGLFLIGKPNPNRSEVDEYGYRGSRFDCVPSLCFYFACAMIVFGEQRLIHKFF